MRIEIDRLDKAFGPTTVLHDIDLEIREREFLGLLGPSGSGKTTLLRILAGLESPDRGGIRFNGRDALSLAPKERRVGFVFQHYALFGHMTVFGNVAFGLHVRPRRDRPARREIADRVNRLLALVQLEGFGDRFPAQLSGGQRQRVALARTLAIEPRVLLLDEPFGALDAKVRIELRRWLREVHETTGLTTVFVTHDQDEALDLADRVAVMNRGRIEQVGTPTEIYESPASPFVYDFLGRSNVFDCAAESGMVRIGDKLLPAERAGNGPALAFVRPHDVVLASPDAPGPSEDATLPGLGTVRFVSVLGPTAWVELVHGNRLIEAEIDRRRLEELELRVGRQYVVRLRLPFVFAAPHGGPDMAGVGRQTQAASRL